MAFSKSKPCICLSSDERSSFYKTRNKERELRVISPVLLGGWAVQWGVGLFSLLMLASLCKPNAVRTFVRLYLRFVK